MEDGSILNNFSTKLKFNPIIKNDMLRIMQEMSINRIVVILDACEFVFLKKIVVK